MDGKGKSPRVAKRAKQHFRRDKFQMHLATPMFGSDALNSSGW